MTRNVRFAFGIFVLLALLLAALLVRAQAQPSANIKASAVEVKMIPSDELMLPAEFQISLYENLIDQLKERHVFRDLYRDGDQNAKTVSDLTTLECTVVKLKKGNETLREVTTIMGATSVTLRCELREKDGNLLWARDITGNVRFFGASLKATYDFAKKTATIMDKDLTGSRNGRS